MLVYLMDVKDTRDKQAYLRTEIIEQGYDPNKFVEHLCSKHQNGSDINTWTLDELKAEVIHFLKSRLSKDKKINHDQKSPDLNTKAAIEQQRRGTIFRTFSSESEEDEDQSPQPNKSPVRNIENDAEHHCRKTQLTLVKAIRESQEVEAEVTEKTKDFLNKAALEASEEQKGLVVGNNKFEEL